MHKLIYGKPGFDKAVQALYDRPAFPPEAEDSARQIIAGIRKRGDEAVADIETNEDFDLMFHTVFCPNIEDRFGETEDENISLNM